MREAQGPKKIEQVIDWRKVVERYRMKNRKEQQILSNGSAKQREENKETQNQTVSNESETTGNGMIRLE